MTIVPKGRSLAVLGVAAILLACGKEQAAANADTNAGAAEITTTATANQGAASEPANASDPAAFNADYMVGKWSAIDENCSGTLEFRKNGTVTTPIGEAKWTVAGDKLAIDYGDGSQPTESSIKVLGSDRIEITHASGTKETEKRC